MITELVGTVTELVGMVTELVGMVTELVGIFAQLNTQVELVEPEMTESGRTTWHLRSRHVTDPANGPEDHQFDYVMVCNG